MNGDEEKMKRVFIQAYCQYPHGGALANYIQNLSKVISSSGYKVILATDINQEYGGLSYKNCDNIAEVIPIMPSTNMAIRKMQCESGYYIDRINVLKQYKIERDDRVIVLGLMNEYFLHRLFEYGEQVGFKIICGVLELFGKEDFDTQEKYNKAMYIKGEVYLKSNAILSISEYIDEYYIDKGMRAYRFPPMVDSGTDSAFLKEMDIYRFVIPSGKDSIEAMLMAFVKLQDDELNRIELHICGVKKERIEEIISEFEWDRLKRFIIIHDWMEYEELINLYKKMHFMLIARKVCQRTLANFPSKVPEVMSYGVVPIVSEVGDYTKYYLKDGYDSVFMRGDSVEEIQKAIRRVIAISIEEYSTYSKNARETAKERFDYHVWVPQIREMLEKV